MSKSFFLPYQKAWINDKSRFKIYEKSRRTGITFAQSWEDVEDCLKNEVPSVWFSSSDESAAKEYIEYCQDWGELFEKACIVAKETEQIERETVTTLVFKNKTKIVALSSNPKAFRSKGGKVVLDEFAFHDNADELWKAAKPSITSMKGMFPLRIISTHNGTNCKYYQFLQDVKAGKLPWKHHYCDILKAVDQGYVDKIYGHKTTKAEREEWLEAERKATGDELVWQQEYLCVPIDEATAFLPYALIKGCERTGILTNVYSGQNFIGIDFGRVHDKTVAWVIEKSGANKITRTVLEIRNKSYSEQLDILSDLIIQVKPRRVCADSTGLGDMPVETLQERFGRYVVEGIKFTGPVKEELAINMKMHFEDQYIWIPESAAIRKDLHSVRKLTTKAGNTRYDASRTKDGHADLFWACSLALHASDTDSGPLIQSVGSRRIISSPDILKGY